MAASSAPFGFGPFSGLRRSVVDPITGNPVVTSAPTGEVRQRSALLPLGRDDDGRLVPAFPQAAFDAIDAARFPGQVLSGEKQVYGPDGHVTDEAIGAACGIAGLAMTGSLPFKAPAGSLRSFGGRAGKADEGAAQPWDLYHGSTEGPDFARFDPTISGAPSERGTLFMTRDPEIANHYADSSFIEHGGTEAAGPRVFRATVDPGKTAVFDIPSLIENSPEFAKAARKAFHEDLGRNLSVAERRRYDATYKDYRHDLLQQAAARRDDPQLSLPGIDGGAPFGASHTFGHIGGAIAMARKQGLDTAILRGLAENGGADQIAVLTPGRVRSYYDPTQVLYSGGPSAAVGALGLLGNSDDAQVAPQGKPMTASPFGFGPLPQLDPAAIAALMRQFGGQADPRADMPVAGAAPISAQAGDGFVIPPGGQASPGASAPVAVPLPPPRPLSFGPSQAAPAPTPQADMPVSDAKPASAQEPSMADDFSAGLARFRANGGFDTLGNIGIGLMSQRGIGPGLAAGLRLDQDAQAKRAATDLARAEYGLKANKLARETRAENQTAALVASKLNIPLEQAAGLVGNQAFVSEFLKGNYGAPEGYTRTAAGLQPIAGGPQDPATLKTRAQVTAEGTTAGQGDSYNLTDAPDGSKIAVNKSDPTDIKIIAPGQTPRPATEEERKAYGIQPGSAVKMTKDGPVAVGGGNTVINNAVNPVLKGLGDQFVEGAATARASADVVRSVQNARSQLDAPGGIYTGTFADNRLALQKLGAAIGVGDPSTIQNTETFRTQIKPIVLETVKGLGAGSGISNADRDFALQAVGGDIKLDEGTIRRVLDITERAARSKIDRHNALADRMLEAQPDYKAVAPMLRIDQPEAAAPSAAGARPTSGAARLRYDPATGTLR